MVAVEAVATTRERLIDAATDVFVEQGYEGTRLQDVARAAGLTTGAVYSNFRNKGELLFEAIGTRSASEIDDLLREVHGATLPAALRDLGRRIVERDARALLLDAVVASRRDPDLAEHLRERAEGREGWLRAVIREAQAEGVVDSGLEPDALARLCTTIALGTLVIRALDLPLPDHDAWGDIIDRIVSAVARDAPRDEGDPS
jgi:AcrR family transcriptional regulator